MKARAIVIEATVPDIPVTFKYLVFLLILKMLNHCFKLNIQDIIKSTREDNKSARKVEKFLHL